MPGSVSVSNDHDLKVPLLWADDVGPVHGVTSGTTVTSSDVAVVVSGDVAADGSDVVLRTAGDGTCDVTVTNGTLTDTISVTVGEPVPLTIAFDAGHATPVAKGTVA